MSIKSNSPLLLDKIPETLIDRIYCQKDEPVLDLSLCTLKKVPLGAIQYYYGKAEILDLSYNHLRSLSQKFALMMHTVTRLNLMRNDLKRLPDNFGCLDKLVHLNVSHNQLQTLPLSMHKMHNLTYLKISDNPLQSPFSSIIDAEKRRLNRDPAPADIAYLVVRLLTEFSGSMVASGDYVDNYLQRMNSLENDEMNKDVYTDDEINETESDRAVQFCSHGQSRNRTPSQLKLRASPDVGSRHHLLSRRSTAKMSVVPTNNDKNAGVSICWRILTGVIVGACITFTAPLLIAFFYETPYLEQIVMRNGMFRGVWAQYKPVHVTAEYLLRWLNIRDGVFYVQAPSHEETPSVIQIAIRKIVDAFTYMGDFIWRGITELLD